MRRRSLLAMGAAGGAAALLGTGTSALAAQSDTSPSGDPAAGLDPTSLRALGRKIGLRIGQAVSPQDISTPAWAALMGAQFDVYTPENEMKWGSVEGAGQGIFDWTGADNLVNFAEANNARVRGHTLVWHNQLPNWLTTGVGNGSITTNELWGILEEHIFTEVGRYKGRIWQWDVCNEFFSDNGTGLNTGTDFWLKALGPTVIPQAFIWAHQADKHALLFYNDYNIAGEDGNNAKFNSVVALVKQMQDAGVPIHGVGNQGHLDTQFGFSGARFQQDLEAYAAMGLLVAVTEADVRTFVDSNGVPAPVLTNVPAGVTGIGVQGYTNVAEFAHAYEFGQMIKAAIAVPEVISFTIWGLHDGESWVPGTFRGEGYATLYNADLSPKMSYTELQADLMQAAGVRQHVRTPNG